MILQLLSHRAEGFRILDWWNLATRFRTGLWYELSDVPLSWGTFVTCAGRDGKKRQKIRHLGDQNKHLAWGEAALKRFENTLHESKKQKKIVRELRVK
jgi:hypothetical protein